MTAYINILNLVADAGLVGCLLYLGYRFWSNPTGSNTSNRLDELENTIRSLIMDAERAGKTLDSQLLRRKQSLEETLMELESVESRVSRTLNKAEEKKGLLERIIGRAQRVSDEAIVDNKPTIQRARPAPVTQVDVEEDDSPPIQFGKVNIFGDEIGTQTKMPEAVAQARDTKKLSQSVERVDADSNIQKIYDVAEQLLKAGRNIEFVANRTKLPVEEVRLLSSVVAREIESSQMDRNPEGERLGVLTGLKRQVEVV